MARSDREIFDDHVAALARRLGVHLDTFTDSERRRLLAQARQRRLNEHEAALTVAYDYVRALLERDFERARVLVDRLALVGRQWLEQNLVDQRLVEPLERQARGDQRHHRG